MEVILNGNHHTLNQASTLGDLISSLELEGKFAVEVNQDIISRSKYESTLLSEGDNIEIVQAIGGG